MTFFWRLAHLLYTHHFNYLARFFELLNYILGSNAISAKAQIGKGSRFWHRGIGCVVHFNAVIGDDCKIFPNVMIGAAFKGGKPDVQAPVIGNHVFIGTGAILLGNIKIGDNAIIGANALVIRDVKSNARVGGVPAKEI